MAQAGKDRDSDREGAGRPDHGAFKTRLKELGRKLEAKRPAVPAADEGVRRGSAMGLAFRVATELVAGVLVGGLIGWQLDKWLGTSPFLLLIFFALGTAAGILNVVRTAWKMQSDTKPGDE